VPEGGNVVNLSTILVPLDGSVLADLALPYAARLARADGGRIVLLQAVPDAASSAHAEATLAAAADRLIADGFPVEAHVCVGAPGPVVVDGARAWGTGLMAMCTHGRSGLGRWLYGSVADHVLRHAEVPVLLVSPTCEQRWPLPPPPGLTPAEPGRVLVPLDGSALGEAALAPAGDLAGALRAGLLLAQVVPFPPVTYGFGQEYTYYSPDDLGADVATARRYLEGVAAPLRATGHDVEVHAEARMVVPALSRLARERDAKAVAMATHGRGGLARVVLGSVATGVLQLAHVPVLVTRPVALR
jgi:nucleotide-binding universal stress UspA family protein